LIEVVIAILPLLVVIAGLFDLTTMKIPNGLNLLILALFYPSALILGLDWSVIGLSSLIGLGVLIAGMAMFALRWLGGGDAKLIAAVALWMGPQGILGFLLLSALVGGLFCLVLMSARFWLQAYRPRMPAWAQRLLEPKGDVPYGVAIAAGALWAYPASDMVLNFIVA
jgi:prepilin peptidase CpaA